MSTEHYWPTEPGWYEVEHRDGRSFKFLLTEGGRWVMNGDCFFKPSQSDLVEFGCFGVRVGTPVAAKCNQVACINCRFSDDLKPRVPSLLACCIRAPVVHPASQPGDRGAFPIVRVDDWCGEFQLRTGKPPNLRD